MTIQDKAKKFDKMPAPIDLKETKSFCCGARMLFTGNEKAQCECCGADGREKNPFNDREHNELLDEKLRADDQEELARE